MKPTTTAELLRHVIIKLEHATPPGDQATLLQVWTTVLGGDGLSTMDVLVRIADVAKLLNRLEVQITASAELDDHTKSFALNSLGNIKPIFELSHLMGRANNLRPNYNQHATGFLGAIAAALRSEFPEPVMSPADINSVSQALNELKELLDSAELPADLRVILQGYISRMVRALADPKAIDMQEVFESTAAATVVARQMEIRTSEPDQKERASKIAGLWNSVGRFVGRAITFGVTHPDQIERLGHDAQGLFAQISSAI